MPTPESEAFLAKKPTVPPTFDGVDFDDTKRLKQAQDAVIREQWVQVMMGRLVREELSKCYYREGVNHLEKCGRLRGQCRVSSNTGNSTRWTGLFGIICAIGFLYGKLNGQLGREMLTADRRTISRAPQDRQGQGLPLRAAEHYSQGVIYECTWDFIYGKRRDTLRAREEAFQKQVAVGGCGCGLGGHSGNHDGGLSQLLHPGLLYL